MKIILIIVASLVFACDPVKRVTDKDSHMYNLLYQSQKKYCDTANINKPDYKSFLEFAQKKRANLYKANSINLSEHKKIIILEGVLTTNGVFVGLVFSDEYTFYYQNIAAGGWDVKLIDKDVDLQKMTGVNQNVIDKIKLWDTQYIENIKSGIGSSVSDGFIFLASKIEYINKVPSIFSIGFYEFP